jgi:hypothetical protein
VYHCWCVGEAVNLATEPQVKRYFATATRDALREQWGEAGVRSTAERLPQRVRDDVLHDRGGTWVCERSFIAFHIAIFEGVAGHEREPYVKMIRRMTELSFGVVRKLLVSIASPRRIFESGPAIWKADHTHGVLECRLHESGNRGVLSLRESPYADSPHARAGLAENLRYVLELSGARGAVETHMLVSPGVLEIKVRWA